MSSFKSTQFFAVATKLKKLLEDVETQFDVDAVPEKEDSLDNFEAEIAAAVEKMTDEEKECITKALEILKKYADTESEEETDETEPAEDVDNPADDAGEVEDEDLDTESKEAVEGEALEEKRKKAKKAKKDADEKAEKEEKEKKKKK
jgi:hypothetical protein